LRLLERYRSRFAWQPWEQAEAGNDPGLDKSITA
jgi:hypothetical protein